MTMPAAGDTTPSGGAPAGGGPSATQDSGNGSDVTLRDRLAPGMGGDDADSDTTAKPKPKTPEAKPEPAKPKYKVRRGDAEEEYDGETLARQLSDDYEHEFTGPGGKKIKVPWADVGKRIAMAEGAKARMERAALAERRVQEERAHGKKDPIAYLEGVLGVEDAERWALELAMQRHREDTELAELTASQDPRDQIRAEQLRQDRVKKQLQRREGVQRAMAEQQQRQQQAEQRTAQAGKDLQDAFKGASVPWSSHTREIGARILKEYADADIHLPPAELAVEVKRAYLRERRAELDAMDGPSLFAYLGGPLRAKLRQLEIDAIKGAKKEERAAKKEERGAGDEREVPKGPFDEAELLRRRRAEGR